MSPLPVPVRTHVARPRRRADCGLDLLEGTLLATVDGRRNVVQLESVAKAIGLDAAALARLEASGLITYVTPTRPVAPPRWPCEHDD